MLRLFARIGLCLLLLASPAMAADIPLHRYHFKTWSSEAGLPQISVYDMVHDAQGYLWVATENGLTRFDGTGFEHFNRNNTPAMESGWVSRLYRATSGRLWVATMRNVVRIENGVFTAQPVQGPPPGRVQALAEDHNGRMWVAGDVLLMESGAALAPVPGWDGPASALLADRESMWVAGEGGVLARRKGSQWQRHEFAALRQAVVHGMAWSMGDLWLASSKGLFRFRDGALQLQDLGTGTPPNLTTIIAERNGGLLLGSDTAIFRFRDGRLTERLEAASPNGFASVVSMRAGDDGSIWLGSQQHGLRHMWPDRVERLGDREGLRDLRVWGFAGAPGAVLTGHSAGIDSLADGRFAPVIDGARLPNPVVYSALVDRHGQRWLGTRRGLVRASGDGSQLFSFAELATFQVNGIKEAPDGTIWVASAGGLFRIDGQRAIAVGAQAGLDEKRIRFLLFDRDARLWVGAERGLFRQAGTRFVRLAEPALHHVFVTAMTQLDSGAMVVGTFGQGMFMQDGAAWRQIGKAQGLPVDGVYVLAQHLGQLVVGHSDGAFRIPLAELQRSFAAGGTLSGMEILLFDQGDRLGQSRVRCCNYGGNNKGVIDGDFLLLATLNGVARINLRAPPAGPPLVDIRALTHGGLRTPAAPSVTLPEGVRGMNIEFGAIDFRRPQLLRYRYRLNGFDPDWVEANQRPSAIYTNLPPGSWRFEVQARHGVQEWGPPSSLQLTVPAYFTEGWPFRILMLAMAGMVVLAWVRWRERMLVRQKRELEEEVAKRTSELAAANEDLAKTNQILAEASVTDTLTGMHNRRYMQQQAPRLLSGLQRARQGGGNAVMGLILVDIDHFKSVNDRFGHAVGDQVLCQVAQALHAAGRDTDYLMRWGGEEFLLVLPLCDRAELGQVAERLRAAVSETVTSNGSAGGEPVTISLGYSGYPLEGAHLRQHEWTTALAVADRALYAAKEAGRDRSATIVFDWAGKAEWSDDDVRTGLATGLAGGRARLVMSREEDQPQQAA